MSKKLLLGIIIVLVITNISTLFLWDSSEDEAMVFDGEDQVKSAEEAIASVNGEEISYQDWMAKLREQHGERELKSMIDREIVRQLAAEQGIEVDDKIVEREISMITAMQGIMPEKELEAEKESWRDDIEYRYQLEFLLTEDVDIPEEEVEQHYNTYQNQYDFTASLQLSHIIVEDFDTAGKVIDELEQGASFDLLAQEYSIDEETNTEGGYLGFIYTSSQFMPDGYEEVADEMEKNTYSDPFAAGQGIAIIYLHRSLPSIEFSYEEMKPYVENELGLHELEQSLSADSLWDDMEIEWIYE
ncbi:peptidylprolyl isomerase [Virgibacillus kimchii]